MGNSASTNGTGASAGDGLDNFDGIETLGYRVLGAQPNSPASKAGLVSFLDFIVGAEGRPLFDSGEDLDEGEEYDDVDFPKLLQEFKGRELELGECVHCWMLSISFSKPKLTHVHTVHSFSCLEYQVTATTMGYDCS